MSSIGEEMVEVVAQVTHIAMRFIELWHPEVVADIRNVVLRQSEEQQSNTYYAMMKQSLKKRIE